MSQAATVRGIDLADIGFDSFCDIMGSFATGVSVLTSLDRAGPHGMTCSAVCSVSAAPPLLLSCLRTPSSTLDAIRACGRFLVNVLGRIVGGRAMLDRSPLGYWRGGYVGVVQGSQARP